MINVIYYFKDFTYICPTEVIAFSEQVEEFQKIGCHVVACSTDSLACHRAWMRTTRCSTYYIFLNIFFQQKICEKIRGQGGIGNIKIPLMSDSNHAISKAYTVLKEDEGVAFR